MLISFTFLFYLFQFMHSLFLLSMLGALMEINFCKAQTLILLDFNRGRLPFFLNLSFCGFSNCLNFGAKANSWGIVWAFLKLGESENQRLFLMSLTFNSLLTIILDFSSFHRHVLCFLETAYLVNLGQRLPRLLIYLVNLVSCY